MASHAALRAWTRQARADFNAASVVTPGISECHRRYWSQQACEKAIKTLGLLLWRGHPSNDGDFKRWFLNRHDPLKTLRAQTALPKSLKLLLQQIHTELESIDGSGLLLKIDATTATTDPTNVSYRYPFVGSDGNDVAPFDVSAPAWDAYQGNEMGVLAALGRFLDEIERRVKRERGPK